MEHQQRYAQLQQARSQAAQQFSTVIQTEQQKAAQQRQTFLQQQAQLLSQKVPDWSDSKASEVSQFLMETYGLDGNEVGNVVDHRLVMIALDAMQGRKARQEAATVVEKKVKPAPKLVAPGKPKSVIQVQAKHVAGLKARAKVTGHVRDAARVIESLM